MGVQGWRLTRTLQLTGTIVLLLLASCTSDGAADESVEDHPSFPCYTWWTASSRVAGLAGVVPYASRFPSTGVITYEEMFDLADRWVPDSEAAEEMRSLHAQIPNDASEEARWQEWETAVIVGVYEWALFNLDAALEGVETADDMRDADRESLGGYVSGLIGFVEDQWALSAPLFTENRQLDETTLEILTNTPEAQELYQAWGDVTDESPFDTDAGIKEASVNVCGEEVLGIGDTG